MFSWCHIHYSYVMTIILVSRWGVRHPPATTILHDSKIQPRPGWGFNPPHSATWHSCCHCHWHVQDTASICPETAERCHSCFYGIQEWIHCAVCVQLHLQAIASKQIRLWPQVLVQSLLGCRHFEPWDLQCVWLVLLIRKFTLCDVHQI